MEKLTKKEKFILKCKNKFGDKYTYDEYTSSQDKIKILCNIHNVYFSQIPAEHLRGKNGCNLCRSKSNSLKKNIGYKNQNKLYDNTIFIEKANKKHNNKYNYSLLNYEKSNIKVKIICPIHGEFEQYPYSHLRGKGCEKCGKENSKIKLRLTKTEFIKKAIKMHNDKYDYSLVNYINSHNKVEIVCHKHGKFEQLPYDHISGHGCEKCTSTISKQEQEINNFLKINGLKTVTSSKNIIHPNQLDIFIPSHNLAIEFNGLYWHSEEYINKDYHLTKTNECEKQGIKLIHIFEDEWSYKQDIVKSRLLNLLGLTKDKIYARKCIIKEVSYKDSKTFLDENHIQGNVNSSIRLGLYHKDELVSLMTFNKPRLGIGKTYDGYELSRFCNKLNTSVIGGADKLLKYFINSYNPNEILSYADRRWSQGHLYNKLGFTEIARNKPNYWYIIGKQRKHRFGFRKDVLKKQGLDSNKTEHQIMIDRGIYRIYDCGTITYKLIIK